MMANRLGIDTGGTFCDFVLLDEQGSIRRAKVPSTPSDPSVAIREGLRQLGLDEAPDQATVGTTIATNAVIERRGPRVIYVGNEDFTDVPFIGRLDKERLYDLHWKKPRPLLSRGDCLGVSGRIGHHGDEIDGVGPAALEKLEADLAELVAKDQGDVVIAILARRRQPPVPASITTPNALRLKTEPVADCARYDNLRKRREAPPWNATN